ncbi:MAG: hypothetical protein E3J72_09145 [Planctomycetota bacterium]|nr:MAG: hypothetical protein E3J72_09145 [Planctomycetota bacterium]
MSTESDLMLVLLALQMNFIRQEQLVEAGAAWAQSRGKPLSDILTEKGFITEAAKEALDKLIAVHMEQVCEGDSDKTFAACMLDEEALCSLLTLPLDDAVAETLTAQMSSESRRAEIVVVSKGMEDRYQAGSEIGRGGLGRVFAARDTVLDRPVAIKEMIEGTGSTGLLKRFLREGEIAGRLSHPNVIPVHDIGIREEGGEKKPYFVMTRIIGRDLKAILHSVENDEGDARHDFSRPRLLRIFQDVCLAMAYAHDNGVIHRDLKPANVMVGKYGEVYAVDWGLAKILSEEDDPAATMLAPPSMTGDGDTPATVLTLEGDVIGTPAYMPPEQASGRIAEVDKQSDIYSLGAILYEILTFRPPFEGENARSVIASVIAGEPAPPSIRASEVRSSISQARKEEGAALPQNVPPDLEEIVARAMAKDKGERYASVKELHEEIQRFLEGEKERERNHRSAVEKISEGKALAESLAKMQTELEDLRKRFKLEKSGIKHYWPMEKKSAFWDLNDRLRDLNRDVVRTFGEVAAKYQEALGFEYNNREARAALADLYWDQYLRMEKTGDENQMIYFEGLVREYNDGQYDARLKGDGTLSVSTASCKCGCLAEARPVPPGEINIMGYDPFSGKALARNEGKEKTREPDSGEPLRLKLHRSDCRPETMEGADVWLFRYVEKRKILIPAFPEGVDVEGATRAKAPADILDRCFDPGSPFRPGEGLHLGRTPVPAFSLPMGSYLLIIAKDGCHPVRVPVHIARLGEEKIDLTLYRDGEIPDGFAHVPAGGFACQGDRGNPSADLRQTKEIGDYFMARFPITCAEYLEFINDIAETAPEEAEKRAPRKAPTAGPYWPKDVEGKYRIPSEEQLEAAPDEFKNEAVKLEMSPEWWEENWPVMSISWEDAAAYAAWKTRKLGFLFSLPHEVQWEKSARGTDGRFYPWGEEMDPTFCNMNQSHEGGPRPCGVDSFPVDESPYGIRGLGGNSCDMCLNDAGEEYPDWRLCRGGYWTHSGVVIRSSYRTGSSKIRVNCGLGARLTCSPHAKVR